MISGFDAMSEPEIFLEGGEWRVGQPKSSEWEPRRELSVQGDGGAWMMVLGRRGRPVKDLLNLGGGWTG